MSRSSAATWGTKAYAFHGRVAPGQGAFSLAHLICMQGTFIRLRMDTLPDQPTELLIPHHSEVMEMSLNGWAGLHPHAVVFIHLTFRQWLIGSLFMRGVLTHQPLCPDLKSFLNGSFATATTASCRKGSRMAFEPPPP